MDQRYLLLTFLPVYRDDAGGLWLERLWHRDFAAHLRYLKNVVLAAPIVARSAAVEDVVALDVPAGVTLDLCELPRQRSSLEGLRTLPALARTLWRAIGGVDIVHSNIAGWPYALGWVANPIALLRRKHLVIVVESAPWRITDARGASWKQRIRAEVSEVLGRFFVNRADLSVFMHPGFRDGLHTGGRGAALVVPASWIHDDDVIGEDDARALWERKRGEPARFLFAGRLTRDKGVDVLLAAVDELERVGARVAIDVIGAGERRAACVAKAAAARSSVAFRVLDPVPYGPAFFALVRGASAVIVPSVSDEQPRVLFDAFSQAVPVIASATVAHATHVKDAETGFLVPVGDAVALARMIAAASDAPANLERLGMGARAAAQEMTLRRHHEIRLAALRAAFGDEAR